MCPSDFNPRSLSSRFEVIQCSAGEVMSDFDCYPIDIYTFYEIREILMKLVSMQITVLVLVWRYQSSDLEIESIYLLCKETTIVFSIPAVDTATPVVIESI